MAPRTLVSLTFALILLTSACGSGDDDLDAGGDTPADTPADATDDTAGDAASGGATRPWIAGEWALASIMVDGETLTLPDGRPLTMTITGPDQISGDGGCNNFRGVISAPFGDGDFGTLTVNDLFMTEMACEPASILAFELAYVEALSRADTWELAPPTGLVFNGNGVELVYEIG